MQEGVHFSDTLPFSPSFFSDRDLLRSAICFYFQQWSVYLLFYYTGLAGDLNCGHTGESSWAASKSFLLLLADLLQPVGMLHA